jgi:hypothetical protein
MNTASWFDDIPVIGKLPPEQAIEKLREVGEDDVADMLEMTQESQTRSFEIGRKNWWQLFTREKPWLHAAHKFGYLAPAQPGNDLLSIRSIDTVPTDPTLRNARIKIVLNRLRIAAYPGGGMHRVLLHFGAQHQVSGKVEDVHFNATYRVQEGEHAGIQGYPIFVGLNVGSEGITFRCRTINVSNDQDEAFLKLLESNVFKAGLRLVTTAQPVVAPFSEMALGIAKTIAARNRNVSVQDFDLGLDFSSIPMGARLAEGSYLAVQIPEDQQTRWNWHEWVYHPDIGQVVKRTDTQRLIPYNYLVFGIGRYEGK